MLTFDKIYHYRTSVIDIGDTIFYMYLIMQADGRVFVVVVFFILFIDNTSLAKCLNHVAKFKLISK